MKILSLKLRGFKGISRGMGLDEIALDLSPLSGLIAFAGPNGFGKSTVLECLSPYRTLASRTGSLSRHTFLRDSYKELTFSLNGEEYRTLVKIDSDSDRSEGFVFRNGVSEVDGKVRNFDRYLEDLIGSPELFFNSVFAAQGSKKISDLTTGELKKLFSEFLRLHLLEQHEQTSKQAAGALALIGSRVKAEAEKLADVSNEFVRLEAERLQVSADTGTLKGIRIINLKEQALLAEDEIRTAFEAVQKNALIHARIMDIRNQLGQAKENHRAAEKEAQDAIEVIRGRYKVAGKEADAVRALLRDEAKIRKAAEDSGSLVDQLEKNSLMMESKQDALNGAIMHAQSLKANYDGMVMGDTAWIEAMRMQARELGRDIEGKHREIELRGNSSNLARLESERSGLMAQMAALDRKDPACTSRVCGLISMALKAQERLPGLENLIETTKKDMAAVRKEIETEIDYLKEKLSALNADIMVKSKEFSFNESRKKEEVVSAGKTVEACKCEIAALKTGIEERKSLKAAADFLASKLPEIDRAKTRLEDLEARIKEIGEEGVTLRSQWEIREGEMLAGLKVLEDAIELAKSQIDGQADEKLVAAKRWAADIAAKIGETEKEIAAKEARIQGLQAQIVEARAKLARLGELEAERGRMDREASEWIYLRDACGAKGLRALEIDSVAPTITGWANDLLSGTFGPSYSVRFRTQDPESGREVLDILALADDGSEILLENLSGGQKTWILKALRLAMTLVSKEKSGKDLRASFADEEDGALDAINAQSFIRMYRSFMRTGGFDDLYFISHRPECVGMADHLISFTGNGIEIE